MVHFKLTAAAAALLAPTVMGAAPTCATTDKYVVQQCDYGTSTSCATGSGVGCKNFVSGVCTYVASGNYLKMTAVTTGGVVTFSQFTDASCAVPAADPSMTRVTWITNVATAECINASAAATAEATDFMYGEAATDYYTYQMHCGADTTVMSQSAAIVSYASGQKLDCLGTQTVDAAALPVVASTATAGFCTRTGAAASTRTKCASGALELQYYATKDCGVASSGAAIVTGTATPSGTYKFAAAGDCHSGCAWATTATCYADITDKTAASASNVLPKKSGTTQCTTLTNVAPAPEPAASPAGIASAALAAVVGLGYLFF